MRYGAFAGPRLLSCGRIVSTTERHGYRVAAHAEGIAGTELAIEAGIDTIEHGMYLGQRPDLLQRMAAARPVSWSPPVTTGHHSGTQRSRSAG